MFVLMRLPDESVMIGHDMMVTLVAVEAERVLVSVSRRQQGRRITFYDESARYWLGAYERFHLAQDISCQLRCIEGDRARLGFELPRTVLLHRREIYDTIYPFGDESRD